MNDGLRNYLLQVKTTRAEHPEWTMKQVRAHVKKQKTPESQPPATATAVVEPNKVDCKAGQEASPSGGCCGQNGECKPLENSNCCKEKETAAPAPKSETAPEAAPAPKT